jgi:hypothetical protein
VETATTMETTAAESASMRTTMLGKTGLRFAEHDSQRQNQKHSQQRSATHCGFLLPEVRCI